MDSFLYLRESGLDAEHQSAQQTNQEHQINTYMEDQKPSWPEHDTLDALQEQHDVTSYLLPMESEDWSLMHQNEFLGDQSVFLDQKNLAITSGGNDATVTSAIEDASQANFVTPDMLHRPHSSLEFKEIPAQQQEHNIMNDENGMTTRSKTRKPDPIKDDTAEETQPKSNDAAERKKKPQKSKKLYCICQQPYDGNPMVQCDGCREWFHCSCVNLDPDEAEDIEWTCDSCPKTAGKVKSKDVKTLAKRDREASAEWAGSDEEEDEELPESPKRREKLKSSTPGKCLLTSCSKLARPESLFCSENCATDHVSEKATTRRKSRATQSPESSASRPPTGKESSKKRQSSSATPATIANENDPIRRNVTKSLTATLKGLIEVALKKDPTLFNPDDGVNSPSETGTAVDTDQVEDSGAASAEKEIAAGSEKASDNAIAPPPPSAMHIAEKLATNIETAMFQHLAEPHPKFPASKPQMCGEKYKGKFRSLLYNLKDKANEIFQLRVITGDLTPENLVSMSGEDMANPELKSMSETLRQKSIKNSIMKIQNIPIIKKTHKGDIIMMPSKDNNNTEDQAGISSPLVKLEEQKPEGDANRSPNSRKSSLSVSTPKSPSVKTDSLDEILARMTNSNDQDQDSGKRRADGANSEERKKRKIDMEKLLGDEDVQLEIGSDDEGIITSSMRNNDGNMNVEESSSFADSKASPKSPSVPKDYSLQPIWHGKTIMQQVSEFESYAYQIGGRPLSQDAWSDIFTPTIWIEGRIPTDRVTDYLTQTQFSSTKELILIDIKSSQEAGNQEADNLLKYFHSRNRYGVVARNKTTIKDFYIIPLTEQDQLPDCLVALNHSLADTGRNRDMLLGVIVLNKKLSSESQSPHERHQGHNSMSKRPSEPVTKQIPEPPSTETASILSPTSAAAPNLGSILQGGELNPLLQQILSNKDIVSLLNKNQTPAAPNNADSNAFGIIPGQQPQGSYQPMHATNAYDPHYPQVTNNQPSNVPNAALNRLPYNQYDNNIPSGSASQQPPYQNYQRNWNSPNPPYRHHDGGRPPPPNHPVRQSRWDTPKDDGYSPYPTGPAAMYNQRDRGPPRGPAEFNRGRGRGSFGQNNGRGRRGNFGDAGRPPRRR